MADRHVKKYKVKYYTPICFIKQQLMQANAREPAKAMRNFKKRK